jgi:hypothetical protein
MAERSKAHDSKSCEVKSLRGFESHSLRKVLIKAAVFLIFFWRDDREAEGARLEIVCTARYLGFESLSLRQTGGLELFGPCNTLNVFHTCLRPMWRYNYKRGQVDRGIFYRT